MRALVFSFAVIVLSMTAAADDPKSRADRLTELLGKLAKDQKAAADEYEAARGDKKKAAEDKFLGVGPAYALKLYKLAEEDPKDDVGFEAAWAAFQHGLGGATAKKSLDLLLTYHVNSPKLRPLMPALGGSGEAGLAALKTIAEKATDRDGRGVALFHLGSTLLDQADNPRAGKSPSAEDRTAKFKEAEAVLARAAKEYGDVALRGSTVADEVKDQLFFLNNLTVGKILPDADAEDVNGKPAKVSQYRGKVVVLDVWATWCVPCKAMIPYERDMVERLKEKPFVLVSLSADAKKETLTKFLDAEPMPWTHWWNGGASGGAVDAYRVRSFPTVFVLDPKGVIRHKHLRGAELEKAVEKVLAEKRD
jgi:thiol-disulfide isomerase/thioredoxin